MARFNPYGNSQIADSISSIAKALIGSADTDAALARARASDALAGYRNSQTNYQNQLSDYLGANTRAIADVLADNDQVRQLYEAFGLKSNIGQSIPDGSVGDMIAPNDVTPAATDGMRGLVRSMLFGGVPGNPQQSAAAGQTLADMVNQQEAYRLLSQSGQSPDRQAAIRLGQTLTEYFDPNAKQNEINANLAAAMNEDNLRFGPKGQGDRDTAANNASAEKIQTIKTDGEIKFEQYKADRGLEADNYATDSKERIENKKIGSEAKSAEYKVNEEIKLEKWKVQNATIEIAVEPGKKIVVNEEAGKRLGLQPNENGLYVLNGAPKPNSAVIKVGEEDVYLTKEQAEAIGIKANAEGIYMIPGKAKAGSKTIKFGPSDQKQVQAVATQTMEDLGIDLEPRVKTAIMASLEEEAAKRFQESNNINSATNYVVSKLNEQFNGQVVIEIDNPGPFQGSTNIPAFVMNELQAIIESATGDGTDALNRAKTKLQKYGYNPKEMGRILNSFK